MIRQEKRQTLTLEKIILLVSTSICALAVFFALVIEVNFTPKQIAERRLDKLAREYYKIYLYPQFANSGRDLGEIFAEYQDSGLPITFLRQLLLYNNGAHRDELSTFQNDKYYCNTNSTGVQYYPRAPYGPQDYEINFIYDCEEK